MPKFTFHLPVQQHHTVEIEAETLQDARDSVHDAVCCGTIYELIVDRHIDDPENIEAEDAYDCPAFLSDGEQIDA